MSPDCTFDHGAMLALTRPPEPLPPALLRLKPSDVARMTVREAQRCGYHAAVGSRDARTPELRQHYSQLYMSAVNRVQSERGLSAIYGREGGRRVGQLAASDRPPVSDFETPRLPAHVSQYDSAQRDAALSRPVEDRLASARRSLYGGVEPSVKARTDSVREEMEAHKRQRGVMEELDLPGGGKLIVNEPTVTGDPRARVSWHMGPSDGDPRRKPSEAPQKPQEARKSRQEADSELSVEERLEAARRALYG